MAKSNFTKRIIIGVLILALIVLYAVFVRLSGYGSGQLNFVVPWGLIAIFISLYLFEEYNRVKKAKRENRREYMNQHRQELLDDILKKDKRSGRKSE